MRNMFVESPIETDIEKKQKLGDLWIKKNLEFERLFDSMK